MKTKLYTVDINGVEYEVKTTCAVLTPEREYHSQEQFVRALKGLQSVSVEGEVTIPDDVAAELCKRHATWNAIRAAVIKLRKSCRNCRWMKIERCGNSHEKRIPSFYCKMQRENYVVCPPNDYCLHFKRKSKSKK